MVSLCTPKPMSRTGPVSAVGVGVGTGSQTALTKVFTAGPRRAVSRLDSLAVAEYVGFHGVCSFGYYCCLGRKSHNLWLGVPYSGSQPTLNPESRHRSCLHGKPY
jgi:hypothetical protein